MAPLYINKNVSLEDSFLQCLISAKRVEFGDSFLLQLYESWASQLGPWGGKKGDEIIWVMFGILVQI